MYKRHRVLRYSLECWWCGFGCSADGGDRRTTLAFVSCIYTSFFLKTWDTRVYVHEMSVLPCGRNRYEIQRGPRDWPPDVIVYTRAVSWTDGVVDTINKLCKLCHSSAAPVLLKCWRHRFTGAIVTPRPFFSCLERETNLCGFAGFKCFYFSLPSFCPPPPAGVAVVSRCRSKILVSSRRWYDGFIGFISTGTWHQCRNTGACAGIRTPFFFFASILFKHTRVSFFLFTNSP